MEDLAELEKRMARHMIGPPQKLTGPIEIVDYDPAWPALYELEATRIRSALADRVKLIAHVGSTSVPGLPAKPLIDIVLEVPDSSDEGAYVPMLEAEGYTLRARESDWFEHRLFKGPDTDVNLHTFSAGCAEVDRVIRFRDRLRTNSEDRELYLSTKRELAAQPWTYMQQYADAKTAIVNEILARAGAEKTARSRELDPPPLLT
jgi:GrpB-like predicted nucleotidyltransferase (UPF0157 family)